MVGSPDITMRELLEAYPGAQRALFRHYHIGGCASCGFRPDETFSEVCARNGGIDPGMALEKVREAHEQDEKVFISPDDAAAAREAQSVRFVDIRTREEFESVRIAGAEFFSQEFLQGGGWPKDALMVVVDHTGQRCLDAAAYFSGHGFENVRALRGGMDAWSVEVDPTLPRYTLE